MTFDPTKPVRTRDGKPARIICTDRLDSPNGKGQTLMALITTGGSESAAAYWPDGRFHLTGEESSMDLINIPRKFTGTFWVAVNHRGVVSGSWDRKPDPNEISVNGFIAVKEITVELTEGEGL